MKSFNWQSPFVLIFSSALFLSSCTGDGIFGGKHGNNGDGGLDMGVAMQGLLSDQSFCFTWKLLQEDDNGKWSIIDQRDDQICSDAGVDSLSDFATCYDGKHFMVQYDVEVLDGSGAVIGEATATSGGGPEDLCVKNTDTPSTATIQFNNEGSAGGVNPGIDVDQVCSNNKLQLEGADLVSALWLQPDSCVGTGTPDSFCTLGTGAGISTQRVDFTADGLTRFIFNTSLVGATWDLIYLAFPADLDLSELHLFNSPFALHHFSAGASYGNEEMANAIGSWRMASSVGVIAEVGNKIVITYDLSSNCDSDIDLDSKTQTIQQPPCSTGSCEPLGVVAEGGSAFDLILSCDGDVTTIPCDANGLGGGICDPS